MLLKIDPKAMKITERWLVAPCEAPASIGVHVDATAFDPPSKLIFNANRGTVTIIHQDSPYPATTPDAKSRQRMIPNSFAVYVYGK